MNSDRSYYDILGLDKNATDVDIKKKWKRLAAKNHPDKLPADKKEEGEKKFKEINEAFSVLSDPDKRKKYDMFGKDGLQGGMGGMGGFDPSDIFGSMFNNQRKKKVNVKPVEVHVSVTLEDLYKGKKFNKSIKRTSLCKTCKFTGFEDKKKHTCQKCKGKGVETIVRQMGPGMVAQQQILCRSCQGSGNDDNNAKKCSVCNGEKRVHENYTIEVEIKQGMSRENGIKIVNQGHEILPENRRDGNSRGDVIIRLNEVEHPIFKRYVSLNGSDMNPYNLLIELDLELVESLCGFVKSFTHLDGRKLCIDESNIIKGDEIRVVVDEGMPYPNSTYKRGCLYIKYNIKYPKELSTENKQQIYKVLTGKQFKEVEVSDNLKRVETFTLEHYNQTHQDNNHNNYNYNDDEDEPGVQCAQQ